MKSLVQDVRYTWQTMRKSPGPALVAVLTLALGIGANAVVFSVSSAFLLHPLNLPEADSLYEVWRANATASESYPDYLDLRDRNNSFDDLVAYGIRRCGSGDVVAGAIGHVDPAQRALSIGPLILLRED